MPQPALWCAVCTLREGKDHMACPESMVGILLRRLINKQHPQLARPKIHHVLPNVRAKYWRNYLFDEQFPNRCDFNINSIRPTD